MVLLQVLIVQLAAAETNLCASEFPELQAPACQRGSAQNCEACAAEIRRQQEGAIAEFNRQIRECRARALNCREQSTDESPGTQSEAAREAGENYREASDCGLEMANQMARAAEKALDCNNRVERACRGTSIEREGLRIANICARQAYLALQAGRSGRDLSQSLSESARRSNATRDGLGQNRGSGLGDITKLAPLIAPLAGLAAKAMESNNAEAAPALPAPSAGAPNNPNPGASSDKKISSLGVAQNGSVPLNASKTALDKKYENSAPAPWENKGRIEKEFAPRQPLETGIVAGRTPASNGNASPQGSSELAGLGRGLEKSAAPAPGFLPLAEKSIDWNSAGGLPISGPTAASPSAASSASAPVVDLEPQGPEEGRADEFFSAEIKAAGAPKVEKDKPLFEQIHSRYETLIRNGLLDNAKTPSVDY